MTDLSPYSGDPDVASAGLSDQLAVRHVGVGRLHRPGGDVTSGLWQPGPTECGPYPTAAKPAKATDTVTVTSLAFDRAMTVQTGDLQQLANGAGAYAKVNPDIVEVKPGASVTVDVTIRPSGTAARSSAARSTSMTSRPAWRRTPTRTASEVSALPYSYTIGNAG